MEQKNDTLTAGEPSGSFSPVSRRSRSLASAVVNLGAMGLAGYIAHMIRTDTEVPWKWRVVAMAVMGASVLLPVPLLDKWGSALIGRWTGGPRS